MKSVNIDDPIHEKVKLIHNCQIGILNEIVRICNNNHIDYWLAYGTMLGAIRHHGFIPWDDDVDIYMTLDGLRRFEAVCQTELGESFLLQSSFSNKRCVYLFAKVRKKGTLMDEYGRESQSISGEFGVWVDIFPLLDLSDCAPVRNAQLNLLVSLQTALKNRILFVKGENWVKRRVKCAVLYIQLLYERLMWRVLAVLGRGNSHYCLPVGNLYWKKADQFKAVKTILPKSLFAGHTMYQFENEYYRGVKDYDGYLCRFYGKEYMIPKRYAHEVDYNKVIV